MTRLYLSVFVLVNKLTIFGKKPDFIIVVGDRRGNCSIIVETLKFSCSHRGGDKAYGNADDTIRFATSKLSNIHFVFLRRIKNLINFEKKI